MNELAPGIILFKDIFLDAYRQIQFINDHPLWRKAEVLTNPGKGVSGTNYLARDTDLLMLSGNIPPVIEKFKKDFLDSTEKCIDEYLMYYYATIQKKEEPQLLRYGVGQKFHDHIDDHPALGIRRLSLSFYINDDYDGGEIEFKRFSLKFKPKANDLLLFPSNFVYNHQIYPVVNGERYAVVQWMA